MKRFIQLSIVILVMFLTACNFTSSPKATAITIPSVEKPTIKAPTPTPSQLPATDTPVVRPPVPVVYYFFVAIPSNTFPAGSVVILPEVLILAPTLSKIPRSPEPAANIGAALQAMIHDPRNAWTSDDISISSITFNTDHADVVMTGKISGVGDIVLMAARMQILMTVFAEASVQTATVTLNGESIANLGISHSSEARPASYVYTRAEIETFMTQNAYKVP